VNLEVSSLEGYEDNLVNADIEAMEDGFSQRTVRDDRFKMHQIG
jgi:hypothetical protein